MSGPSKLKEKDLTTGDNIASQIVRLALPILGTSFVQMLYNFTDMAWLGRLSSEAVSAVGAVALYGWLAGSLGLLTKVGSEITIAYFLGKKEFKTASHYASTNSTIAFLSGALVTILFLLFTPPLLSIYTLGDSIARTAAEYMRIYSLGFPFFFMTYAFTGAYNACGHSKRPFMINSIGLIANIILDPIFIFVLDLKTDGAAYATIISEILVWVLFYYFLRERDHLLGRFPFVTKLKWETCRRIIKIGAPPSAQSALFAFINMYMGRIASLTAGHIGVLSITSGGQIEGITWNTAQGFSTALGAFISQNYAAQAMDRVKKAFRSTLIITSLFGVFTTILYVFFGEEIFAIIVPDPVAYIAGGVYLRINGFSQLFMMLEITTQGFFHGIGRSTIPAAVSIFGNLVRIPLAYTILYFYPSIEGLWYAIAISTTLKGLTLFYIHLRVQRSLVAPE